VIAGIEAKVKEGKERKKKKKKTREELRGFVLQISHCPNEVNAMMHRVALIATKLLTRRVDA
jgi:hypothetical protein